MGPTDGGDHGRQRQGHFQAGECRSPENLVHPRDESRRCQILLRRERNRRARAERSSAHSPRHPHDCRLGQPRWLFCQRQGRRNFLRRADVALPQPVRVVQFPGVVQLRPVTASTESASRAARAATISMSPPGDVNRAPIAIRVPAMLGLFHPIRRRHDGRHHGAGAQRSDAVQVRQRHGHRPVVLAQRPRETLGRRTSEWAVVIPESLRRDRQRGQIRRQDAPRGQDEHAQGLAPGYQGVHRREAAGRAESLGAHRTRVCR